MNSNTSQNTQKYEKSMLYKKLTDKIGAGGSSRIPLIWEMICDEEEANLLLMLPDTVDNLAKKTGRTKEKILSMLEVLFYKGVVFEKTREGITTYHLPKNLVQLHDASINWPEAPEKFFQLWKEFMDEEYPNFLRVLESSGLRPFMRVIPINKSIEFQQTVLPYELAAKMIEEATNLAVTDCTCRKVQKRCKAPLHVCLQLNRGADYVIKRGIGKKISKQQALNVLKRAEDAGLVHLSENSSKVKNVICSCCTCCCMALQPLLEKDIKVFVTPSRFQASINPEICIGCFSCLEKCPAKAISKAGSISKLDEYKCIGCGLCVSVCSTGAIRLNEIRPPEFIP